MSDEIDFVMAEKFIRNEPRLILHDFIHVTAVTHRVHPLLINMTSIWYDACFYWYSVIYDRCKAFAISFDLAETFRNSSLLELNVKAKFKFSETLHQATALLALIGVLAQNSKIGEKLEYIYVNGIEICGRITIASIELAVFLVYTYFSFTVFA